MDENDNMNTADPMQWQIAQQKLARRQKILDALQAQAMQGQQGQFISNGAGTFYAGGGALGGIGQGIQNFMVGRQQKKLDTESQNVMGMQQAALADEVQKYQAMSQTDPRAAAIHAVTSSFPQLQKLGAEALKSMEAGKIQPKDLVNQVNPENMKDLIANGTAGFVPKAAEPKEVGGILYDPKTLKTLQLTGELPSTLTQNGDLYEKNPSTNQLKKLDNAPRISTTNNVNVPVNVVNKGEESFMKKFGDNTADQLKAVQELKQTAQKRMVTADKLEKLNTAGTYSGTTANAANFIANTASTLGISVDKAKLNNTQGYVAALGKEVADVLTAGAGVGRSMTDADREAFMSQFPQLTNTPEGRQQIINMLRDGAKQDIGYADEVHGNLKKAYPEAANLFDIIPSTREFPVNPTAPAASAAKKGTAANPMSPEEYREFLRKGK